MVVERMKFFTNALRPPKTDCAPPRKGEMRRRRPCMSNRDHQCELAQSEMQVAA